LVKASSSLLFAKPLPTPKWPAKFLVRAGYIRQLGAGIYNYLFLGQRSLNKIISIVREEMDKIGQEFYLRASAARAMGAERALGGDGDNMFRLKDRKGADLCLGMTHEEIMTSIARSELRSYKQLPQIWYQIQAKFRDEPRPKSGLLRVRPVHHEGQLLLRYQHGGPGQELRPARRGVPQDLYPLRAEVCGR